MPPLIYINSPHFECERPESNSPLWARPAASPLQAKGGTTSLSLLRGIRFGDFSPSETKRASFAWNSLPHHVQGEMPPLINSSVVH